MTNQHQNPATLKSIPRWCHALYHQLENSFASKRLFVLLALLVLPTLWAGKMADDYYHAVRLTAPETLPTTGDASFWHLFSVSNGDPDLNRTLVKTGVMPWWTSPEFRFQMWRPLAELSHWLDYRLWPDSEVMMHAHQLLWITAFFTVVLLFYRRFTAELGILALSFALFAFSANLSQTLAWLSGRNTLMAATLGIAALLAHVSMHRMLAVLLFGAALLSSEYGLSAAAWIFAWTVTLDRGSWWQRGVRLIPYGGLMLVWGWIYALGQHGVAQSDYYIDPLQAPLNYMLHLIERVPIMLFNAVFNVPPQMFGGGDLFMPGWLLATLGSGLFMWLIRNDLHDPRWRFFLLGSLLCTLPVAAGPGGPRTLAYISLGLVPMLALLLRRWLHSEFDDRRQQKLASCLAWPVVVFYLLGLVITPASALMFRMSDRNNVHTPSQQLPITATQREQTLVLLNPKSVLHAIFYPLARTLQGLPTGTAFYPLTSGKRSIPLQRDSERSFILRPPGGFMTDAGAFFMRPADDLFQPGERIPLPGMEVEILTTEDDGRPSTVRFSFPVSLESEQLQLLRCEAMAFHHLEIPAVGETRVLPPCD